MEFDQINQLLQSEIKPYYRKKYESYEKNPVSYLLAVVHLDKSLAGELVKFVKSEPSFKKKCRKLAVLVLTRKLSPNDVNDFLRRSLKKAADKKPTLTKRTKVKLVGKEKVRLAQFLRERGVRPNQGHSIREIATQLFPGKKITPEIMNHVWEFLTSPKYNTHRLAGPAKTAFFEEQLKKRPLTKKPIQRRTLK